MSKLNKPRLIAAVAGCGMLAAAAAGSMTVQQALDEAQAECEAQITLT